MTRESINSKNEFIIGFENFNGSGWTNSIEKILIENLSQISIKKRTIEQTWDYSEIEFDLEEDSIKVQLHIDDAGPIYLKLMSEISTENKQKLREWATIIAEEVEKLKNK